MDMHEALLRDFGLNIPIIGQLGISGTRNNPIVIITSDPVLVGQAANDTLLCLHRGMNRAPQRKEGILWRSLSSGLQRLPDTDLGIYHIERKRLSPSELITETVAYYFDLSAIHNAEIESFGVGKGLQVASLGLDLPSEIGWLHRDLIQDINYAEQHNRTDLGVGAAYGAAGIKATLYIYPAPHAVDTETLQEQFELAAADVEKLNIEVRSFPDVDAGAGKFLRVWQMGQGERATALTMSSFCDHFIKIRTTWERHPFLDTAFHEFNRLTLSMFAQL